jgi:hypothetical protein
VRGWRTTLPVGFIYLRRPSWGILTRSRQFGEQRREEGRGEGSLKRETGGGGGLDRRSSYVVYLQIWLRESGATRCWALAEDRYWNLCPWVDAPLRQATQGLGPFPCEGACINNTGNFGLQDEPILRSTTLNLYFTFSRNPVV